MRMHGNSECSFCQAANSIFQVSEKVYYRLAEKESKLLHRASDMMMSKVKGAKIKVILVTVTARRPNLPRTEWVLTLKSPI